MNRYNRDSKYTDIINAKLGKNFTYNIEIIKDNQCVSCSKRRKNNCRLNILYERCVNYESKNSKTI